MSDQDIRFNAAVFKVQTLADGGIRVTLDLAESEIESMAKLVLCHKVGAALEIIATPLINKTKQKEEDATKGKNQQSRWKTPQGNGVVRPLAETTG